MRIIAQDGNTYIAYEVEQRFETINCKNPKDRRKKVRLGIYKNIERAVEVFDEIRTARKYGSYVMPEE